MARLKFDFHTAVGGNPTGIGDFRRALDEAGIPFFAKSADGMPYEAQKIARDSDAPHTVVFRRSVVPEGASPPPSGNPDVPDYNKPPYEAAVEHWEWHRKWFPPELDPAITWVETINEVDKNRSEWLAKFAIHTAALAIAAGYKWAAFGWSTGEPEPEHWEGPHMLDFLRLVADNPDKLAIALHEYSLEVADIWNGRTADGTHNLIGRFEYLHEVCDRHGIARPPIMITEWGWTLNDVPGPDKAMADYLEVGKLYAQYPNILGAATWYLGPGYGGIADKAQKLIAPLTTLTLNTEFPDPEPGPDPEEDFNERLWAHSVDVQIEYGLSLNPDAALQRAITADGGAGLLLTTSEFTFGGKVGQVAEDAETGERFVYYVTPPNYDDVTKLYGRGATYGGVVGEPDPEPDPEWRFEVWPTEYKTITQSFGARPEYYEQFGLPGHEGVDFRAPHGSLIFAVAPGVVSDVHREGESGHNYGTFVRVDHGNGFETTYAHMDQAAVAVGDFVSAGHTVGWADATGNSDGSHLHLTLKHEDAHEGGEMYQGYPYNIIDPTPYLTHLLDDPPPPPPPTGTAAIGLHAGADGGDLSNAELAEFRALQPGIIKVLSSTAGPSIAQLAHDHPDASFVVRAFLDFGGRNIRPYQFVHDTINDVRRALDALAGRDVVIELHNEPNLVAEGLYSTWSDGISFKWWWLDVLSRYRNEIPDGRFIFPGLSPGETIPNVRLNSWGFLRECRDAVRAAEGLGVHVYWAPQNPFNHPLDLAVAEVDAYTEMFPDRFIWVTEASNNQAGATPDEKATQYVDFWQALKQFPAVRGVTYFVASANNPVWGWDEDGRGETWVPVGMGQRVRERI